MRYRCIKYGIKMRVNTWNRKIHLKKSVLMRLYVREKKSLRHVAEILSCSSETVIKRCKEHGIPLRSQRIEGLTKALLKKRSDRVPSPRAWIDKGSPGFAHDGDHQMLAEFWLVAGEQDLLWRDGDLAVIGGHQE